MLRHAASMTSALAAFGAWCRMLGRGRNTRRGTAGLEFAITLPVFLMLVIGTMEITWQLTIAAALDRGTLRASRFGTTGQTTAAGAPAGMSCRSATIPWIITSSTGQLLRPERLQVTLGAAPSASRMGEPPVSGPGLGGEVVTYSVTYTQPFMSAAWLHLFGGPSELVHRTTVVVKNEAFDNASC
jgi:hypothetical protein